MLPLQGFFRRQGANDLKNTDSRNKARMLMSDGNSISRNKARFPQPVDRITEIPKRSQAHISSPTRLEDVNIAKSRNEARLCMSDRIPIYRNKARFAQCAGLNSEIPKQSQTLVSGLASIEDTKNADSRNKARFV